MRILLMALASSAMLEACQSSIRSNGAHGTDVVASVNGVAVSAAEARTHVRPRLPRIGAGEEMDPRADALARAIRARLFADEARRRRLEPAMGSGPIAEAHLIQALIRSELDALRINRGEVSDEDAREYYETHREFFHHMESVEVSSIAVRDERFAEELLRRAEHTTDDRFAGLVARYSVDEESKVSHGAAVIDAKGGGAEDAIARVARKLRRPGLVGLAKSGDRYYVIRASKVRLAAGDWNEEVISRAKNLIYQERRERALSSLERRLRDRATIVVLADALGRISAEPAWASLPPPSAHPADCPRTERSDAAGNHEPATRQR